MASLPAFFFILSLLFLRVQSVPIPQNDHSSTEIQEVYAPTGFEPNGSLSEEGSEGEEPCKSGTSCGIHVFRVALSSRPEEVGDVVPVKARKKYGNNVYVPRGSQDSFVLRDLAENLPAYIDSRVKDRISDKDFVIKPLDGNGNGVVWVKEGEPLPKNFEPMRYPSPSIPPSTVQPKESSWSYTEIILIMITGLLAGVILTSGCALCIIYNRRPRIDRSAVVTHRRGVGPGVSRETIPLPISPTSIASYPPLQLPSSVRSSDSSQSTFDGDGSMEMAVYNDDSSLRTGSSIARGDRRPPPRFSSEPYEPLRKISL